MSFVGDAFGDFCQSEPLGVGESRNNVSGSLTIQLDGEKLHDHPLGSHFSRPFDRGLMMGHRETGDDVIFFGVETELRCQIFMKTISKGFFFTPMRLNEPIEWLDLIPNHEPLFGLVDKTTNNSQRTNKRRIIVVGLCHDDF